uniref:ubiquitinyl hydrolase 1 n=1 Tax=Trichobilharzia regenti TaxID=157069 RepID=A0AA85K3D0_TRIRE|nr:unnamed protein product [Trichobilharzia regenti]
MLAFLKRFGVTAQGRLTTPNHSSLRKRNVNGVNFSRKDGSLCAQHCLNALLQGPYFTAVDLANIASQLDEQESSAMGSSCSAIGNFQNMDETGYFSVQVICKALQIWSLELVPFLRHSTERRRQFNIFIIGTLPECEADQVISICPVTEDNVISYTLAQQHKTQSQDDVEAVVAISQTEFDEEDVTLRRVLESSENDDPDLQRALQISADENKDMFDMELQKAISISLTAIGGDINSGRDVTAAVCTTTTTPTLTPTTSTTSQTADRRVVPAEEIRRNRQAFLDKFSSNTKT